MKYEEFKRRKRQGRLPRKMPVDGFAKADLWGMGLIVLSLLLMACESNGWLW